MSILDEMMESADIGKKFARIREVFDEEFAVLSGSDKIHMLLQVTTQQVAIMLSDAAKENAREKGEAPNIVKFLVSIQIGAENTSEAFAGILSERIRLASELVAKSMSGEGGT